MGAPDPPPPPDYGPVAAASQEAADQQYDIAQKQLAFAQQEYADNKVTTDEVTKEALATQDQTNANAQANQDRFNSTYIPLENQQIAQAQQFNSQSQQALDAGSAEATVGQSFNASRTAAQSQLESFGINPASTRYAALDIGTRSQQAAATASAGNLAIQQDQAKGIALTQNSINQGMGLPAQTNADYTTGISAGNSASGTALAQTASATSSMGSPTQYYAGGNQSIGNWAGALNDSYNNQIAGYNAQNNSSSGIGSLLGAGFGAAVSLAKLATGGAVPQAMPAPAGPPQMSAQGQGQGIPDGATPGGQVPVQASPSQGQATDDVPARLTAGEFVVPKDVAAWKGEEFFQNLIEQARKRASGAQAKPQIGPAPQEAPAFQSTQGAPPQGMPTQ